MIKIKERKIKVPHYFIDENGERSENRIQILVDVETFKNTEEIIYTFTWCDNK